MERDNTPTVILASAEFEDDLKASAEAFGLPRLQYVVVPDCYNNLTKLQAVQQTEPVVNEIIRLLCSDPAPVDTARDLPTELPSHFREMKFLGESTLEALEEFNRAFLVEDWGDGYPLWPPTQDRVTGLLSGVEGAPDDVICLLPPGNGVTTVKHVAINAAMAGCVPGDMPVVMAALRAIAKMKGPGRMALMSTSAHAPLVLVNGPVGRSLSINGGRCCLGPGKQNAANLRLGRAILLCLKNLGRWYPGIMDMDTIGTARKFSLCLAENEEESPWEPYHVSMGHAAKESTVTVFFTSGEQDIKFQGHVNPRQLAKAIAANVSGLGTVGYVSDFVSGLRELEEGFLLLVAPPHARPLHEGGFTKESLGRFLYQHSRTPVQRLIEPLRKLESQGKIKPEYAWLFELSPEEQRDLTFPLTENPTSFHIVVAGSARGCDLVLPTFGRPSTERVVATPTDTT